MRFSFVFHFVSVFETKKKKKKTRNLPKERASRLWTNEKKKKIKNNSIGDGTYQYIQ